jgi:hypothetical protein
MPLESPPVVVAQSRCPRCGAAGTRRAPETADEAAVARFQLRIRAATAAAWEQGRAVRGPDGTLLWTGALVWLGSVVYAWTTSTLASFGIVRWALLLGALVLAGTWADRRAARRRGWIDPMRRADEIARDALAREASVRRGSQDGESRVCLQCGHRFEPVD